MKWPVILFLFFLTFLMCFSPALAVSNQGIANVGKTWNTHKTNLDLDVYSQFSNIQDGILEVKVDKLHTLSGGYKWNLAVCSNSNQNFKYMIEGNDGTFTYSTWQTPSYQRLSNFGFPVTWCLETNGMGYALFSSGSSNQLPKRFRLNLSEGAYLYLGSGTEVTTLQEQKSIVYNFDWGTTTIHLECDNTPMEDLFVYWDTSQKEYIFGANGNFADIRNCTYTVSSTAPLLYGGSEPVTFYNFWNDGNRIVSAPELRKLYTFAPLNITSYKIIDNIATINFTSNGTIKTDSIVNVTSCRTLAVANDLNIMNNSFTPNGITNCIIISAQNVTLDCQGYNLFNWTYKLSVVYTSVYNTTIRNCNIITNYSTTNSYPIQLSNTAFYSRVYNNSLSGYNGIYNLGKHGYFYDNNISNTRINGVYHDTTNAKNNSYWNNSFYAIDVGILGGTNNTILQNNFTNIRIGLSMTNMPAGLNIQTNTFWNVTTPLQLSGSQTPNFNHTISRDNIVNGNKRIVYNFSINNTDMTSESDTAYEVYCAICNNVTMNNLNLKDAYYNLYLWNVSNSVFDNITISNSSNQAITLTFSKNVLITNYSYYGRLSGTAISVNSAYFINLTNVYVKNSTAPYVGQADYYGRLDNFTVEYGGLTGSAIFLNFVFNKTVSNIRVSNYNQKHVYTSAITGNNFYNLTLTNNPQTTQPIIELDNDPSGSSYNNTFQNVYINGTSNAYDFWVYNVAGGTRHYNLTLINVTSQRLTIQTGNPYWVKWYYQAKVSMGELSNEGWNVSLYNRTGFYTNLTTDSNGYTPIVILTDVYNNGTTSIYSSNYTTNLSARNKQVSFIHNLATDRNVLDTFNFNFVFSNVAYISTYSGDYSKFNQKTNNTSPYVQLNKTLVFK